MFEGWDDDPRELYEIPEVRKYFFELNNQWSYWFHFCEKFSITLGLVMSLLVPLKRATIVGRSVASIIDPFYFTPAIYSLFNSLNGLYDAHNIGIEKNKEISNLVEKAIGTYFVS